MSKQTITVFGQLADDLVELASWIPGLAVNRAGTAAARIGVRAIRAKREWLTKELVRMDRERAEARREVGDE